MMPTDIKICGLSTPESIAVAVEAGATHVGLVHYEPSPRHVDLRTASALRRTVPEGVKVVAVTVNLQPADLARVIEVMRPDVIQFHGSETPEWLEIVRDKLGMEVWRALGLRERATLERARQFEGKVDRLLFDSPAKALPGGNGTTFAWELLEGWEPFVPWGLAGGLNPDNVGQAIARVAPPLVDASSGLESAPGVKEPALIRAFCDAVRTANEETT